MIEILGIHVAASAFLAGLTALVRRGRFGWDPSIFLIALLLPGAGAVIVVGELLLEGLFRRTVRTASAADWREADRRDASANLSRNAPEIEPLQDVLEAGDATRAEVIFRRLAKEDSPQALARLRGALGSPSRELRIRARSILARLEDRTIASLRGSDDPAAFAKAYRKLASLTLDPATERRYLAQAAEWYGKVPDFLEVGRICLELGEYRSALEAFDEHVRTAPDDPDGYLGRADAKFRLGDLAGIREDWPRLKTGPYAEVARRWRR